LLRSRRGTIEGNLFRQRCDMERVMGIEPTLAAWEAAVLPLNYTRVTRAVYAAARGVGNAGHVAK
jgi:hypothetical protein